MRKAFSDALVRAAAEDPRLLFLTGDLGFGVFDEFIEKYGSRYINVGVAEAQLINAASGMALEGRHVIAYSIASFATARPFEQIRFCAAYHDLPVVIVGAGRGFTYSTSGVSHHSTDDIALMSSIPNMTVVIPGDPTEIEQLLPQVLKLNSPAYFTVGRFGEPRFEALEASVLGKARLVRKGEKIAILSTGEIVNEVIKAADRLKDDSIYPYVYQFHTVKPLDISTMEKLTSQVNHVIVVDEHLPNGGLWSAIANWKIQSDSNLKFFRLGPPDEFALGNLNRESLRSKYGYDSDSIYKLCKKIKELDN